MEGALRGTCTVRRPPPELRNAVLGRRSQPITIQESAVGPTADRVRKKAEATSGCTDQEYMYLLVPGGVATTSHEVHD